MIVDPDMPDHWKTRMLGDLVGSEAVAICTLIRLWAHCQNRRKAEFENLSAAALKAVCRFDGDAESLESSLVECGFVERNGSTLKVIGWEDHNSKMAAAWSNGKRGGRPPKSDNPEETQQEPNGNPKETQQKPTGNPTKESANPQETGRKEGVGRGRKEEEEDKGTRASALSKPDYLDAQVWNDYRSFRTSKKAKLTRTAWSRIEKEIQAGIDRGYDPNDMLGEAMEAGWTGFKLDWYEKRIASNAKSGKAETRSGPDIPPELRGTDWARQKEAEWRREHGGTA